MGVGLRCSAAGQAVRPFSPCIESPLTMHCAHPARPIHARSPPPQLRAQAQPPLPPPPTPQGPQGTPGGARAAAPPTSCTLVSSYLMVRCLSVSGSHSPRSMPLTMPSAPPTCAREGRAAGARRVWVGHGCVVAGVECVVHCSCILSGKSRQRRCPAQTNLLLSCCTRRPRNLPRAPWPTKTRPQEVPRVTDHPALRTAVAAGQITHAPRG